ncbi:MAG: tetratricopeptide repeat protein [Pseudomonadota bacterium]
MTPHHGLTIAVMVAAGLVLAVPGARAQEGTGPEAPESTPAPEELLPDPLPDTPFRGPELPGDEPEQSFPTPTPDDEALAEEGLESLDLPDESMGREAQLDALFEMLRDPESEVWPVVQAQIWRVWRRSGSDSVDFLLYRAREAIDEKAYDKALTHLDDVVRLAPEFAEGWNQRATVYFLQGRYAASVADIEAVLAIEPRHFGALSGLGIILDRTGKDEEAMQVFRRVIEIHPNQPGAQNGIDKLSPDVDGRDL